MIDLDFVLAQGDFTLEVHARIDSPVTALFGPSGAGKTTLLDALAGLRRPTRGKIVSRDRVLFSSDQRINLPPHARHVGYVPQDVALFPHMDVRRNLEYGSHEGASPSLSRVLEMLEIGSLIGRRVRELSGGERQRVALGRALMSGPSLLLLDEPLAAVDVPLRRRILPYLGRVRDELRVPILYVTHDPAELQALADRVLFLDAGRIVRSGAPTDI